MAKNSKGIKLVYRIPVWKFILFYSWSFFFYLCLWMLGCILLLYGLASLWEWSDPDVFHNKGYDSLLETLMIILGIGFLPFYFFLLKRKIKTYHGTILQVMHEEEEGEINTVDVYYLRMLINTKEEKLQIDHKAFKLLRGGMTIKMKYDRGLAGLLTIYQH